MATASDAPDTPVDEATDEYFDHYDNLAVHEVMLRDGPRTLAYKSYIEKNAYLFKDKVVMDVGAGTGILSMFAAKAGAKKVIAIEGSRFSQVCQALVNHNGLGDIIEVVPGRVEELELDIKVDVIISEWMGFYLFTESMLNSVIVAREKWLSPDGHMVPATATLYMCPVNMKQHLAENVDWWADVYGFNFSPLVPLAHENLLSKPHVVTLDPSQCLAEKEMIASIDIMFVTVDDIKRILGQREIVITKNSFLHGFACWFEVEFEGEECVTLSTGPEAEPTHWQQTVFFLPDPLMVSKKEVINCQVLVCQDATNERKYNLSFEIISDTESDEEEDGEAEKGCHGDGVKSHSSEVVQHLLNSIEGQKCSVEPS